VATSEAYPDNPRLAVSAVIVRDGKFLVVCRARPPAEGLFTLPGGRVKAGETLVQAVRREVREETGLTIEAHALAGYRDVITRSGGGVESHFVVLTFAARWVAGEPRPNEEISEIRWIRPAGLAALAATEGLGEIVAAAFEILESSA